MSNKLFYKYLKSLKSKSALILYDITANIKFQLALEFWLGKFHAFIY